MKILLTGGSGFLGKHIITFLSNKHKVSTLSRQNSTFNFDLSKKIPSFDESFEIVIHAAGKAHDQSKRFLTNKSFDKVNVIGLKNLLTGLEKYSLPSRFVFISSVSVYGLTKGTNISESFELLATDEYGLSKIEGEKIVQEWCKDNQVKCLILRLPLLVGQNPPGNLGIMIKSIKMGYYFNINGGKAKKSMVLADDVSKIILKASEIGGIFNLTDGNHPDFNQLSYLIAKQFNKKYIFNMPVLIAQILSKIGDFVGLNLFNSSKLKKIVSDLTFDDSKARKKLNWKPSSVIDNLKI
jgi:nucleoside-diphosphate-sugar epimerase